MENYKVQSSTNQMFFEGNHKLDKRMKSEKKNWTKGCKIKILLLKECG
jgi:hypothetical protein